MPRSINDIADDLDALNATLKFAFTQMDKVISGHQGTPSVMAHPDAKFELFSEDGRSLDLRAIAEELRQHATQNPEA